MKKVNLVVSLKNVQGETMKEGSKTFMLNEMLANIISVSSNKFSAIRLWDLALKLLHIKEAINIDDEDFAAIKEIVKNSDASVLVKGQLLKIFKESEEQSKKDKS